MMLTTKYVQKSSRILIKSKSSIIRTLSAEIQRKQYTDEKEWDCAKPYSEIPGPSKFKLIKLFMPGGKLNNANLPGILNFLRSEYGELVKLPGTFGKSDIIFTMDPKNFEILYRTEGPWPIRKGFETFNYYRQEMRPEIFKGMGGLTADQGEKWLKMRSAVNPVMLQPKIVKTYIEPVDEVARDFIEKIKLMRNSKDEMPDNFGIELNQWALESIGVIALDQRLGVMSNERNQESEAVIKAIRDFFRLTFVLEVQPSLWRFYKTSAFNQLMESFDIITNIVKKYVDNAVEKIDNHDNPLHADSESVLQRILKIDRHYAVLMAIDMLFAGIDTTSSATATLFYNLAKNPDKQDKLRQEILELLPDVDSKITAEGINKLPYLRACIKESMRLQPVVAGTQRGTAQNIVLDGYQIPKGTDVVLPGVMLATEEKYFAKSLEFIPERWLRNDANASGCPSAHAVNPFIYLPFGFGPRACIGKRFAELEIQILTIRILREFKIEWNYEPIKYATNFIFSPASNLKYKFTQI